MSPRRWGWVALLVVLQLAGWLGYRRYRAGDHPLPVAERLDRAAPELTLRTESGSLRHLSEWRGRPVLVHVWASWCPPCRTELPALLEESQAREVGLLAVSLDSDWATVRSLLSEPPPSVVLGAPEEVQDLLGVDELPETFVVSAEGRLVLALSGAQDWRDDGVWELVGSRF